VEALASWEPTVQRTTDLLRQLDGLLEGTVGRHVPVGDRVVWRDRDAIRFARATESIERYLNVGDAVQTDLGVLKLTDLGSSALKVPAPLDPGHWALPLNTVLLDADALDSPLCLRTWRAGDRIAPHGLSGTKRVSDVLTERQVRPSERDRQLVLCVGDRVAWVVGHRLARWAGMSERTQRLVHAMWEPKSGGQRDE
jgi:tRNA(Ile)-lysidine synthase